MLFTEEKKFEDALIEMLSTKGWEADVLEYPTEEDLIKNWANILYENNRDINRLNDHPLTNGEMQQLLEQIANFRTPYKLNEFINGKSVSIIRDNPDDKLNFGKEISLKIYDRKEIAAGQSRYQIARQPQFKSKSTVLRDRRGDLMLLINGMPVFHIELKKSGIPVSQAYNQIEKYSHEGIFSGLFALVQIFVAMTPEETVYFANPGPDGKFKKEFYFHWENFNNDPINDWKEIAATLLSIPMAHQLIGFYTVADATDGILKVMRSYQYYASAAISDRVAKMDWTDNNLLGGYIWHTTGSGKTMTSFKSAQLIADSGDADKVVFLVDRKELGTQSLYEYRNFARASESVQSTENTGILVRKLKSDATENLLIVTSIQKMSRIKDDDGLKSADIRKINNKRLVFIVDEAHRSTFGEMLITIKETFPHATFFGFTGTPILDENEKDKNTTATVFGNELHRYSIADGIRDKNVLGFDPYKILTYRDRDLKEAVALEKAKAKTPEEALSDPNKKDIFNKFMHLKMAGYKASDGTYIKGIEDYIPPSQYNRIEHKKAVVADILKNWTTLSCNKKFHAIFATSSILEAIQYYRLFKEQNSGLKITALFDPNEDNEKTTIAKQEGLAEIITDYNELYDQKFSISTHDKFKKDVAARLAHKEPYLFIERFPEQELDLLIVVNQMLTGFDSKWLNTLYLDKKIDYENIIQAFSRTNRVFGPDKPHGTIRYYRYPHTMEKNIEQAIKLYSGDKPFGLFVERLEYNLNKMNSIFDEIVYLFNRAKVENFEKLPTDVSECAKFAKLFKELNEYLDAARIQGFNWKKSTYHFGSGKNKTTVTIKFDETIYKILALRYKELQAEGTSGSIESVPYDIDSYLIEIDTDIIDADYMNSRFDKYRESLTQDNISPNEKEEILNELHKSFATLSQDEQKYANIFLHDVQSGKIIMQEGKKFRDYVTEYMSNAKNDQISKISQVLGLDECKLRAMMSLNINENNLNEYGRFDELIETVNKQKAKEYFEKLENKKLPLPKVNIKIHKLLREFILKNGIEIQE